MNFSDVFKSSFLDSVTQFSFTDMILAMIFACIIGLFILFVYKKTFSGVLYSNSFAISLVGLSMVTTLVILAVTSNVVLSLGMVGALSIVRFRAAIKDPMEIVYLFWSLAAGIVVGAGLIPLAVIGSAAIGILLFIICNRKTKDQAYILVLNCEDEEAEKQAMSVVTSSCKKSAVKAKTVRANTIEVSVELRLKDAGTAFVNSIQSISGVDSAVLVSYNGDFMS